MAQSSHPTDKTWLAEEVVDLLGVNASIANSSEDMAFSEDNQRWIREQIQESVLPNGFRKVAHWLRYWGLLGVVITAFLALIGMVITLGIFTTNKINQEGEFRGKTEKSLEEIEKRLIFIEGSLANVQLKETLKSLNSSPSPDPRKTKVELARVTDSFQTLGKAKVNLPEQTVTDTGEQLIALSNTHRDLPETWTAIGAFITYRSQMIHGWQETSLPLCTNQFHKFKIVRAMEAKGGKTNVEHGPVEIHDCKIILDSPETTVELSPDLSLADVVFTHCTVFYSGGPIVLVPVKMATDQPPKLIGRLTFTDCQFIVSLSGVPAANGTDFARALLSSSDNNLTLTSPS